MMQHPIRPRRNRKMAGVRDLIRETTLTTNDLLLPLFLLDGQGKKIEVSSMPGIYRYSIDGILNEIEEAMSLGIKAFDVFPVVPEHLKDQTASYSWAEDNFYLHALASIKQHFPEAVIMTDVAMDPYSSDGHDGLVIEGEIVNDATLEILARMAVAQAQAGADIIGPSDMMDGRVGAIRTALDAANFTQVSIMSYTAKYASGFYGPFRDALDSAPKFGDKKTYQMDPANRLEALREMELDTLEGADMLMVKPALAYLDVIRLLKDHSNLPITAYNVSGEYAMLKAASEKGWLDYERVMMETLLSIKRAGADVILTYHAKEAAKLLK